MGGELAAPHLRSSVRPSAYQPPTLRPSCLIVALYLRQLRNWSGRSRFSNQTNVIACDRPADVQVGELIRMTKNGFERSARRRGAFACLVTFDSFTILVGTFILIDACSRRHVHIVAAA